MIARKATFRVQHVVEAEDKTDEELVKIYGKLDEKQLKSLEKFERQLRELDYKLGLIAASIDNFADTLPSSAKRHLKSTYNKVLEHIQNDDLSPIIGDFKFISRRM